MPLAPPVRVSHFAGPLPMMEKNYDPAAIESRVSAAWEEARAFRPGQPGRENATPYCIVIPPPNVTGSLHMGHALNNTLQDILCRFERMRGKDVLWQPGTDHAGIATQMVVERQLMERQLPGRREMGREKFLQRVWEWKAESGGTITNQLKRLGASCDWSRERFTMDPGLSEAVIEFFVRLNDAGLIYKDKRLVNWDPKLLTAISDLEVEQIEIKGNLWYFNYPLEGVDYNPEDARTFITVATTRPETMLGDGAVAVHPENERLGWMIGKRVILPLVGRIIPIVADSYADPEKGTGAVKITAAHDFNDYEVGKRHNLPLINLFNADATLNENTPEAYRGLDRYTARKRVVADLEALGLLNKVEPHTHMVPHGDRSGVVIEPWLTDQWYVNVKPLAERAIASVRSGGTRITPANKEADFYRWMENIEPWCISRQLWWGHQIPAWYGPDGAPIIARNDAEAHDKAKAKFGRTVELSRDPDVLDTWFSSALWPFSTLGWPEKTRDLARFYPTSALVTAADILFFWVARMMMAGLFTQEEVPFRNVYLHGLVRDEKGQKMSKTKGNVLDPLDVIETYGADALRFTIAAFAAQGRDPKLGLKTAESYRNFCTKLWNACRFAEMNGCERVAGFDPKTVQVTLNRWIIAETARTAAEVTAAIEAYRFNDAANAAYRFVWNSFCDWYVELSKSAVQGPDSPQKSETQATTAYVIDEILKILHPFMPFITEELWAIKGEAGPARETLLCLARWPQTGGFDAPEADAEIGWLIDLVSDIRSTRAEMKVSEGTKTPLVLVGAGAEMRLRAGRWAEMLIRLAKLSDLSFADHAPPQSVQLVIRGEVACLPLAGVIDIDAEKTRLARETERLDGEIIRFDAKLNNVDFVARAKEEVVEEQREKREAAVTRLAKVKEARARLG